MIEYPTKVLLATDGSGNSVRAIEVAVAFSGKTGAELHVVHVGQAPSPSMGTRVHSPSLPTQPYESVVKRARKLLKCEVEQIRKSGGNIAETHLRIGSPPYEVVGLSDEIGADLIVVGSGRPRAVRRAICRTIRRAAIGAVAGCLVRRAYCPLL